MAVQIATPYNKVSQSISFSPCSGTMRIVFGRAPDMEDYACLSRSPPRTSPSSHAYWVGSLFQSSDGGEPARAINEFDGKQFHATPLTPIRHFGWGWGQIAFQSLARRVVD